MPTTIKDPWNSTRIWGIARAIEVLDHPAPAAIRDELGYDTVAQLSNYLHTMERKDWIEQEGEDGTRNRPYRLNADAILSDHFLNLSFYAQQADLLDEQFMDDLFRAHIVHDAGGLNYLEGVPVVEQSDEIQQTGTLDGTIHKMLAALLAIEETLRQTGRLEERVIGRDSAIKEAVALYLERLQSEDTEDTQ